MPRKTRGKAKSKIVHTARKLRREQMPTEKKLWEAIRDRRLAGLKFRRQHPYEQFILDAFCVEHQIEVEVDGEYHDDLKQAEYDAERMKFLIERGIRVLRFTNFEVENDLGSAVKKILETIKSSLR